MLTYTGRKQLVLIGIDPDTLLRNNNQLRKVNGFWISALKIN